MSKTYRNLNEDKQEALRYDLRREMTAFQKRQGRYYNLTYCRHGRPMNGACPECDQIEEKDIGY